jgi:hypothetical protein
MRFWLFVWFLFFAAVVHGQSPGVSASLDSTRMLVGDQVWLRLQVELPREGSLVWPQWRDTLTSGIEVLRTDSLVRRKQGKEGMVYSQSLLLTCFDSGTHRIPPQKFVVDTDTLWSLPLLLEVMPVTVDMQQGIKDIKPLRKVPLTFSEVLPWAGGVLLLLLLIMGWRWYARRRRRVQANSSGPSLPPDVLALNQLEALRVARLWQKGRVKEHYTRLTDILRQYLDARFDISAPEMTSEDLLRQLKKSPDVSADWQHRMRDLLTCADLAKFARHQPEPLENERYVETVASFVQETRRVSEPAVPADNSHVEGVPSSEFVPSGGIAPSEATSMEGTPNEVTGGRAKL